MEIACPKFNSDTIPEGCWWKKDLNCDKCVADAKRKEEIKEYFRNKEKERQEHAEFGW
jgi:hypothetical protein